MLEGAGVMAASSGLVSRSRLIFCFTSADRRARSRARLSASARWPSRRKEEYDLARCRRASVCRRATSYVDSALLHALVRTRAAVAPNRSDDLVSSAL